jgi:hypothetical protein
MGQSPLKENFNAEIAEIAEIAEDNKNGLRPQ